MSVLLFDSFFKSNTCLKHFFSWGATGDQLGRSGGSEPALVALGGNVIESACGEQHCLVLTDVGVFGFGSNRAGQLGLGFLIIFSLIIDRFFFAGKTLLRLQCPSQSLSATMQSNSLRAVLTTRCWSRAKPKCLHGA